jgi:hypothetical protein
MFWPAIQFLSDTTIAQAFGQDMIGVGAVIFILGIIKPINICIGVYGSSNHNKFALLCVLLMDAAIGVVQFAVR